MMQKKLCCQSATEQHELQSDLVNVMQQVLYTYMLALCSSVSTQAVSKKCFCPGVYVTVAHMLNKNKVS